VSTYTSCGTTSRGCINWLAVVGSWDEGLRAVVEGHSRVARRQLAASLPGFHVLKNTKAALPWQHVDDMLRTALKWPMYGAYMPSDPWVPLLGSAIITVGEYSGVRPMAYARCENDQRCDVWRDKVALPLKNVTLFWGKEPSNSGSSVMPLVHLTLIRNKYFRSMPFVETHPGVHTPYPVGHAFICPGDAGHPVSVLRVVCTLHGHDTL
jgi:hypothetical protein